MIFLNNFGKSKHGFFGAMKVINADKLMDDGEYEEILEDMREEGRKFGKKKYILESSSII